MPGRRYTASADAIMPMTDHFLTFIPQPAWMAVCHCDSLLFVSCSLPLCDSRRTSTKMLRCSSVGKMARLFGCSFAFTLIFFFFCCKCLCHVTTSLFLFQFLHSHVSSCSSFLSLFSPSFFDLEFFQAISVGGAIHQTDIFVLAEAFLQRFRDLREVNCSLAQPEPWKHSEAHLRTHTHTHRLEVHIVNPADSCCRSRCQKYSVPSTSTHVSVLLLLHLYCPPEYIWNSEYLMSFSSPPQFTHVPFLLYKLRLRVICADRMHCLLLLVLCIN